MASVRANPNTAYENSTGADRGFKAVPRIKEPNTMPIPTPEPLIDVAAIPPARILPVWPKELRSLLIARFSDVALQTYG